MSPCEEAGFDRKFPQVHYNTALIGNSQNRCFTRFVRSCAKGVVGYGLTGPPRRLCLPLGVGGASAAAPDFPALDLCVGRVESRDNQLNFRLARQREGKWVALSFLFLSYYRRYGVASRGSEP